MRIFSIQQACLVLPFQVGDTRVTQSFDFSQDPDDSSIVRLRVTPPADDKEPLPDNALAKELEFDRNGRVRSERDWPMRYPAWDKRDPATIEEQIAAEEAARAVVEDKPTAEEGAEVPVPAQTGKRGRGK